MSENAEWWIHKYTLGLLNLIYLIIIIILALVSSNKCWPKRTINKESFQNKQHNNYTYFRVSQAYASISVSL